MGFTALDGLPMGTRCGGLDPGVVLWLAREKRMSPDEIETLLAKRVDLLIDGGAGRLQPTTVIDMTGDEPLVTRVGLGAIDRMTS